MYRFHVTVTNSEGKVVYNEEVMDDCYNACLQDFKETYPDCNVDVISLGR